MDTIKSGKKQGVFRFFTGGIPSTKDTFDLWTMARSQFQNVSRVVIEQFDAAGTCFARVVDKPTILDTAATIDHLITYSGSYGSAINVPNSRGSSNPAPSGVMVLGATNRSYFNCEISPEQSIYIFRDGTNGITLTVGVYEN
jgi:hypothetical protein